MTSRKSVPAYGAVRVSPDGERLAWYRPASEDELWPWLVISEDPQLLGVEHCWLTTSAVAGWIELADPDVVRADDAADPVPAGLADRVRAVAAATLPEGGGVR